MKRILLAILAILYLTAATGTNLHFHYCMGELAGWNFGHHEEKICGRCGMEKNGEAENTCCKDEFTQLKLKADQKSGNSVKFEFKHLLPDLVVPATDLTVQTQSGQTSKIFSNCRHYRSSSTPCYITHCNFRI